MASLEIGANLPVNAVQTSTVQPAMQPPATTQAAPITSGVTAEAPTAAASSAAPQVQTSMSVSAGAIPIDHTRIDQIRKAIKSGNYPLVPAKVGDAMVAAGLMLRKTS